MASDYELTNQLYSFMQAVPVLWNWNDVDNLHAKDETHAEIRGPLSNPFSFDMRVLEKDAKDGRTYLHVMVTISDPARDKAAKRGSAWSPLSTSFLWYEDGELDMPTAREIYERSY